MATPLLESKFDKRSARYVYVYLVSLMLGVLNYYPVFFPLNEVDQYPDVAVALKSTQDWLTSLFNSAASQAPGSDFYPTMRKLIIP